MISGVKASETPGCAAPVPADVESLVALLPDKTRSFVPYREETRHPAFAEPEVATGMLSVEEGRLIRDQRFPEPERAAIGDQVVSVTVPPSTEANILPIPAEMQPLVQTLRAVITRDASFIRDRTTLAAAPAGGEWVLTFPDLDPGVGTFSVTGCGGRIRRIDVAEQTGIRRTMILGAPE